MLLCQSNSGNYPDDPARGMRRVVRMEKDGSQTIMADRHNGSQFIAPNDLCVDTKGRIYFTDPYYPAEGIEKSQPTSGVYRIDTVGKVSLVITDLEKPNGILITPDNTTMYVSDRGTQKLHRYKVLADGGLEHVEVVYDFSPDRGIDGMCMDEKGLIYGAAGEKETTGIYVIDPESKKLIERKLFPEMAFNVAFGGEDGKNLYVAAGGSIYLMRTFNRGLILPGR